MRLGQSALFSVRNSRRIIGMKKVNVRALAAGLAASVAMTCLAGVSALAAPQA